MSKVEVDFERMSMLLDIVQKVHTIMPQHTYLASAAGNELKEMNDAIALEAKERKVTAPQERITGADLEANKEIVDEKTQADHNHFAEQEPGAAAQQPSPVRRTPVIRRELAAGEHMTEATSNG